MDHIDRNKLNNNLNNLRYISHAENMKNTDKYLSHITELDPKKRNCIRAKEYAEKHYEVVLQKIREYYKNNKQSFHNYSRLKYHTSPIIELECGNCKKIYEIKECNLKNKKTDLCLKCISINNLPG